MTGEAATFDAPAPALPPPPPNGGGGRVFELDRRERAVMAGVALFAAGAFASTMSAHVALGDAPEAVVGVRSLGILHAPGYFLYVIAARLFAEIVRVGSFTFRVHLFSAVCTAAAALLIFRIARWLGADRLGSAVGSLVFSLATSVWFYAGYAKHDAFSMLLVVVATWMVVRWDAGGSLWWLAGAGTAVGATVGAAWQLGALVAPGLALLVVLRAWGRALPRAVVVFGVAGLTMALLVVGATMARAHSDPTVNWGDATTRSHMWDLLRMRDYGGAAGRNPAFRSVVRGPGGVIRQVDRGLALSRVWGRTRGQLIYLRREVGWPALVLAALAARGARRRIAGRHAVFLLTTFVLTLVVTAVTVGSERVGGVEPLLRIGNAMGPMTLVVVLYVALGATELRRWAGSRFGPPAASIVAGSLAAGLVLPSLVVHHDFANHRGPAFADGFAADVFAVLPRNAVVFVGNAEVSFPLLYAQRLHGLRRDVQVVAGDGLTYEWYRAQTSRRMHIALPKERNPLVAEAAAIEKVRATRPVFLDMRSTQQVRTLVGYTTTGIVTEVVDGRLDHVPPSLEALERRLRGYRRHGVETARTRGRFPNPLVVGDYRQAQMEMARTYYGLVRLDDTIRHLWAALRIQPDNPAARSLLPAVLDERARRSAQGL